jgi:hypothetical protein
MTGCGGALGCLRPRRVRKPLFSTDRDGSGSCVRSSVIQRISSTPSVLVWSKGSAAGAGEKPALRELAGLAAVCRLWRCGSQHPAAVEALEREAQATAGRLGVDHLEMRNLRQRHPEWPTQDLYVSFRKEIAPEVEANMQAIPRKQRAMVRKGIKNGCAARSTPILAASLRSTPTTFTGMGHRPCPGAISTALQRVFADDCEVLTVVDGSGRSLSSVLSFYFRDEVLPYYAGDACRRANSRPTISSTGS